MNKVNSFSFNKMKPINTLEEERRAEASVRRKTAQRWDKKKQSHSYRKAAANEHCHKVTLALEEELFPESFLSLNGHNDNKAYGAKKRIVRRIVEKRQSQQVHRHMGRTDDRYENYFVQRQISKSMHQLHRYAYCA